MDNEPLVQEDFLVDQLGNSTHPSPLSLNIFTPENERFLFDIRESHIKEQLSKGLPLVTLERAGPRQKIFFNPAKTRAAVVTCGGLCPGINNVLRSLTLELLLQYKIVSVIGYRYGYKGIADPSLEPLELTMNSTEGISEKGGSLLGSSRGPQSIPDMVKRLVKDQINILFIIGGDGTMRGAEVIYKEIKKQALPISIVCIPKTIDNDIPYISRSFGFQTAYSKALESIQCVHTESRGFVNGIGIVKVMGRHSGAIAANATISSHEVNFCLIPEVPFKLEGEGGLLKALEKRLKLRGHAVIVIAEGAAQDLIPHGNETDESGNLKLVDSGLWLKEQINSHFHKKAIACTVKYIDPSYIIRSISANADDALFCTILGQYAVHAAMAGRTGIVIGQWNHFFAHLPIKMAISEKKFVNTQGSIWSSVLQTTGQSLD